MFVGLISKGIVRTLRFNYALLNENLNSFRYNFHTSSLINRNDPVSVNEKGCGRGEESCFATFDEQMTMRRQQAQRSIVVQVHSEQSCYQLHEYCSQFGDIANMHHYTVSNSHFVLLEFNSVQVLSEVMKACGHHERSQIIPTYSRMVWFRANQKKKMTSSTNLNIPVTSSTPPLTRTQLLEWLENASNISDQILLLYRVTQLDDLGVRLRYVTAYQIEAAVTGLFPRAKVFLFGSSVNGFGRQGCDLDLVLQLDTQTEEEDAQCRLMFQAKPSLNARSQTQRHIDGLADLVQWFLPGCTDVRRILLARVPIVKFRQELTDIECDLSLTNKTAVYMSEMLYLYGAIDWRLRPLMFTIKRWAAEVGLTNPSPGRWVTNFSLTLLTIFYMQQAGILPPLNSLRKIAGAADRRISDDGVDCTFLRDPSKLTPSDNNASLESLLIGFYEYFATFDFAAEGIALGTGTPIKKRDHTPLFIVNPLETHLNVSQNVSLEETERLRTECRNAAWELERFEEEEEAEQSKEWGLLRLFREDKLMDKARKLEHMYFAPKRRNNRLVPVSKLFEDEPEQITSKSKSKRTLEKNIVR